MQGKRVLVMEFCGRDRPATKVKQLGRDALLHSPEHAEIVYQEANRILRFYMPGRPTQITDLQRALLP